MYGRNGQPCPRCGETVEARPVTGRRTLYWCPGCQVRLDQRRAEGGHADDGSASRRPALPRRPAVEAHRLTRRTPPVRSHAHGCAADRHRRRRLQRGDDAGLGARPDPGRLPSAHRGDPRQRRPLARRHRGCRPGVPATRAALPLDGRAPAPQPRLRRQPEVRLPVGDRARPRHRRAPPRRRPVRARAAGRHRRADRRAATPRSSSARGCSCAGGAREGGMPLYKYVGNRILTRFQNRVVGAVAQRVAQRLPRLLASPRWRGSRSRRTATASTSTPRCCCSSSTPAQRIVEVPIPTYYGDEICYVNGLAYARDVASDVVRYRLARIGFGTPLPGTEPPEYEWKPDRDRATPSCSDDLRARPPGPGARPRLRLRPARRRRCASSATTSSASTCTTRRSQGAPRPLRRRRPRAGIPAAVARARALRHGRRRRRARARPRSRAAPRRAARPAAPTALIVWPACRTSATGTRALRVVIGRFDYDARGILDRDHVRFFTRRSFGRLAQRSGWRITATRPTGLPFDVVERGGRAGAAAQAAPHGRLARPGLRPGVADDVRLPVRAHARTRADRYSVEMACRTFMFDAL